MIEAGSVISYMNMCLEEGASLQRGMNFRLDPKYSVVLMSVRPGAPYMDAVQDSGKTLIYEGHNVPRAADGPEPKTVDQEPYSTYGTPTQNGKFAEAANRAHKHGENPERVKVYEKVKNGIWVYNGVFHLKDSWQEISNNRQVFKFRLELAAFDTPEAGTKPQDLEHTRIIPTAVKQEVWARDEGKCVTCGSSDNLHFDHNIPFSKGGSSLIAANIQLLCARHNLEKHNKII